ncbi:hypothetical protein ABCR94_00065 [Streptomyces sp. 21So2-11]|uniref:hypothetical protein n=1 Tax=Streptomyces sp. 21So2-11 TaxID=3144408 RepID=UPI003219A3F3
MIAAVHSPGVLAVTVHVLDPVERLPLVLPAGTEVGDPAIAEQITNPKCWQDGQAPELGHKTARKPKPAQD